MIKPCHHEKLAYINRLSELYFSTKPEPNEIFQRTRKKNFFQIKAVTKQQYRLI